MAEQQERNNTDGQSIRKIAKNRNMLIFLAFVVLSSFLWFFNYLSKELTTDIDIKYKLSHIPETIKGEEKGKLVVEVKGQGYELLQNVIKTKRSPLLINFDEINIKKILVFEKNKDLAYILTKDLIPMLKEKLGEKVMITALREDTIFFSTVKISEKKVPIDISDVKYELKPGYKTTSFKITPDSVIIFGQKNVIDTIKAIKAKKIDLGVLKKKRSATASIICPNDINISHNTINISYEVELYTETSKQIEIKALNFPDSLNIKILPENTTVYYKVPLSHYNEIQDYDFEASVDYKKAIHNSIQIEITSGNPHIDISKISPQVCNFILSKK